MIKNDMNAQNAAERAVPVPAYMARIKTQIRDAEAKADESLLANLTCMSSIIRARQSEENLPAPHIGQDAIIRMSRAVESTIKAQNDLFRSHNALVDAKTLITGAPGHDDTLAFAQASDEVRHVA